MATNHIPVLLAETLTHLNPQSTGCYVDGTLGGGGHTIALLGRSAPTGRVLAIDRDPTAVERFTTQTGDHYGRRLQVSVGSYEDVLEEIKHLGWSGVEGILLDLGLSSLQLGELHRGFSFQGEGVFDLRFDPTRGEPAYQRLKRWNSDDLTEILAVYGELRSPRRLADQILAYHHRQPILTTSQLLEASGLQHPRKRAQLFQAFRIAVNDELGILERSLPKLWDCLVPGGRLVVITFHSLEDRIVKHQFRRWQTDKLGHLLTKKPVLPTPEELKNNPRVRSAKLRGIEKSQP